MRSQVLELISKFVFDRGSFLDYVDEESSDHMYLSTEELFKLNVLL